MMFVVLAAVNEIMKGERRNLDTSSPWPGAGSILSVESNQNVESKMKNVESKTEKCAVQNSILSVDFHENH